MINIDVSLKLSLGQPVSNLIPKNSSFINEENMYQLNPTSKRQKQKGLQIVNFFKQRAATNVSRETV